jgi:hypothetical protein
MKIRPTSPVNQSGWQGSHPPVSSAAGTATAAGAHDHAAISPGSRGRENVCIDVTLQAFKDSGAGAVRVGGNVRFATDTWDPEQPVQTIDGLDQMACAAHHDPCTTRAFIGDYFGLAISAKNVYGFFVSTHFPSAVIGDQGTRVYYQPQVLAAASRAALGL